MCCTPRNLLLLNTHKSIGGMHMCGAGVSLGTVHINPHHMQTATRAANNCM